MASLVSFIRSAARATSSAYRSVPIRWRLAGGSALLTFVILLGFAVFVGGLTTQRIRNDFNRQVTEAVDDLQGRTFVRVINGRISCGFDLDVYASAEHAAIRLVRPDGRVLCQTINAPDLGRPTTRATERNDYRVDSRPVRLVPLERSAYVQYARPISNLHATIRRVRFLLGLGVIAGTVLALLAGLALARRAMRPIAALTATAREVERTRDPARRIPSPHADDEVAELARTLEEMLRALDASRTETEETLARQREFVADASHELRTPLTSVLANLEILADDLEGEDRATAAAALRSTQRMRRLVADLLLLARADAGRTVSHRAVDLADVVIEAAAELEPVAGEGEISIDAEPAIVEGAHDELHRLALNLLENAVRHTPPGTEVRASVRHEDGQAVLVVEDEGRGVPPALADRIFDRFVRGASDRGGSSGLGLSIVRAVAEAHGGTVALEPPLNGAGARFVVRLPASEQHDARREAGVGPKVGASWKRPAGDPG